MLMRKQILLIGLLFLCLSTWAEEVHYLTSAQFRKKICDYRNVKDWTYKGTRPCVIDFYTTWCGPCKLLAPIMDELSCIYDEEVDFYKVDIDQERELANVFGIHSIPQVLYVPVEGQPILVPGFYPRENIITTIDEFLLKKKK